MKGEAGDKEINGIPQCVLSAKKQMWRAQRNEFKAAFYLKPRLQGAFYCHTSSPSCPWKSNGDKEADLHICTSLGLYFFFFLFLYFSCSVSDLDILLSWEEPAASATFSWATLRHLPPLEWLEVIYFPAPLNAPVLCKKKKKLHFGLTAKTPLLQM